jgi:hypothetical protein
MLPCGGYTLIIRWPASQQRNFPEKQARRADIRLKKREKPLELRIPAGLLRIRECALQAPWISPFPLSSE